MSVKVTILPNGPILVAGPIEMVGADTKAIVPPSQSVALCRCGHSKVKPFCDGSHRPNGFRDPAAPTA